MDVRAFDKTPLMEQALLEAHKSLALNAIPIGAVLVSPAGEIIARGHNTLTSPLQHAELIALASLPGSPKLPGYTLVTTLEPCIMCAGAILNAQIDTVIFGAWDEKFGAAGSVWDLLRDARAPHHPQVFGGVLEDECSQLLRDFFARLRSK